MQYAPILRCPASIIKSSRATRPRYASGHKKKLFQRLRSMVFGSDIWEKISFLEKKRQKMI